MAKTTVEGGEIPTPDYNGRLLRLAEFLENLPPERFDYSRWVGKDWEGKPDLSCGTTACALGWAATMPEFQELGLSLGVIYSDIGGVFLNGFYSPREAARVAFGLSPVEYAFLFDPVAAADIGEDDPDIYLWSPPSRDASAAEVAGHIRKYVKWRSA